jgi:ATP-dependent DNA helicase PIF1
MLKVKSRPPIVARWRRAKALIIDEISMVDGDFFDKLEYVARMVRGGTKPWGELQLIITGDFFQLPPVSPSNSQKVYAFQADCWYKSFEIQMELTHVFRQSDVGFVSMLNEIRQGKCSTPTLQRLQSCHGPTNIGFTGVAMTRLYPHKTDVSYENDQKLRALGSNLVVFRAKDDAKDLIAQNQLKGGSAPAVVTLCVGAQVNLFLGMLEAGGVSYALSIL